MRGRRSGEKERGIYPLPRSPYIISYRGDPVRRVGIGATPTCVSLGRQPKSRLLSLHRRALDAAAAAAATSAAVAPATLARVFVLLLLRWPVFCERYVYDLSIQKKITSPSIRFWLQLISHSSEYHTAINYYICIIHICRRQIDYLGK